MIRCGLKRHADWEARFLAARECKAATRFRWGVHDCCVSPCDLIAAMTGVDPAQHHPGGTLRDYRDAVGARAAIGRCGGFSRMIGDIAATLGCHELAATGLAQRGDAVLVNRRRLSGLRFPQEADLADGLALAVVDLCGRAALLPGLKGWAPVPLDCAVRAWRIG